MEQTQSIEKLIKDIDADKVTLPEFQRDFVWEITKTYDLFDSIVKDIFVGAIIYGIPSFEIAVRDIDTREKVKKGKRRASLKSRNVTLEEIQDLQKLNKSDFRLVLDGQQRITSLYRSIKGIDSVWFIARNDSELENSNFDKATLEELLYDFDGSEDSQRISIKLADVWEMDSENLDDDEIKEKFFEKTEYYKNFSLDEDFDKKTEFKKFRYLKKKITELFKHKNCFPIICLI